MPSVTDTTDWQQFLATAAAGDHRGAGDCAAALLARGIPMQRLILDVLAPAQHEVGLRWQSNRWTVTQEHISTAVVDRVLETLELQATSIPTRAAVLVACVEGEYHTLPARMGAQRLALDGWDVTFAGANVHAQEVQRIAAADDFHAVVLSCTMTAFLPGAARSVSAVADLGLPAVAAGVGFGSDPARARRLGASGHVGPLDDPTVVLGAALAPANHGIGPCAEAIRLEIGANGIRSSCMALLMARAAQTPSPTPDQVANLGENLDWALRVLGVALAVAEDEVFDEFTSWLHEVEAHRGRPVRVLASLLAIMAEVLAAAGLRQAARLCSASA